MEQIKIHLIEDDEDDVFFVKEMLANHQDYEFLFGASSRLEDAEAVFKAEAPDVVLLDLSLPDSSGVESVTRVKALVPMSDIIVLTGNRNQEYGIQALKLGASDYVIKDTTNNRHLLQTILYSRERKKMTQQLLQSQKVEAIGLLAGGVAHDFNNQLAVMSLLINDLNGQAGENDSISRLAGELSLVVERCNALTKKILSFGRVHASDPVVFEINALLSDLLPLVQRLVGSSFKITHESAPESLYIKIDKNHLEQIIWNLAINARDAAVGSGKLHVSTSRKLINGDSAVVIEFKDNGEGIDDAIKDKIFTPFFTTKSENHGTGLGLSTVLDIVKQNGGGISVESQPGATTFRVRFPEVNESQPPLAIETPDEVNASYASLTVLLCEDDPTLLELTESLLVSMDFEVLTARDGEEGLSVFMKNRASIDLIISDLTMPKIDGAEMARLVRKVSSEVKIIFVSGYAEGVETADNVALGAKVLGKPYGIEKLTELINEMFHKGDEAQ